MYYACQIGVRPPTIALVVNNPKLFVGRYERYLVNRLHDALACSEVPIRLVFRNRRRQTPWQMSMEPDSFLRPGDPSFGAPAHREE